MSNPAGATTRPLRGSDPTNRPLRRHVSRHRTVLLPVLALIALALCGLLVLAIGTAHYGGVAVVVGVVTALLPVGVVVAAFLWVDRWEPEPAKLLLLAFGWGACVATLSALLINSTAKIVGDLLLGRRGGDNLSVLLSAPLVEETLKGAFLLGVWLLLRKEFDGVVDGIVYAGFTAAGFAFTENIYYFGRIFAEEGLGTPTGNGVLAAFLLRAVLSPFTHPVFTALIGIGLGLAARSRGTQLRVFAPIAGFGAAVGLHALWNGAATLGGREFMSIYFLVMVPIFAGLVMLINWHRRREQRIVTEQLPSLVRARLVVPSEVKLLASMAGRRQWRKQARAQSGRRAERAVGTYQAAVTELAFLQHNAAEGTAEVDVTAQRAELIEVLREARAEAVRGAAEAARRPAARTR